MELGGKLDGPAFAPRDETREVLEGVPDYGFRVKLDHRFPEERVKPLGVPRLKQVPSFLGLAWRYAFYWNKKRRAGKKCFIDIRDAVPCQQIYGVPIGGIGSGSIGRGFRGEFCRFQMIPGMYKWRTVDADQFIVCVRRGGKTVYQQVLNAKPAPPKGRLGAWRWAFDGAHATYHALYPRAWTVYDLPGQKIRLTCRQVSPIIPHDYQDSSLPTALFVWTVDNMSDEDAEVSIVMTFKNGIGCRHKDRAGGVRAESFVRRWPAEIGDGSNAPEVDAAAPAASPSSAAVAGVLLHQTLKGMPCTYVVSAKVEESVRVTCCTGFDPCSDGADLWQQLSSTGHLAEDPAFCNVDQHAAPGEGRHRGEGDSSSTDAAAAHHNSSSSGDAAASRSPSKGKELAVAVCTGRVIPAGCRGSTMEICLAWYMPEINFGGGIARYRRRYTRWFNGPAAVSAPAIAAYALAKRSEWEDKIDSWQQPVLNNKCLPAWYKSALFNELYFVSDGGTVWLDPVVPADESGTPSRAPILSEVVKKYSKFAYLEGHEYRMYNTYDVHFYASFVLVMLWPYLQLSLQYDMAQAIPSDSGHQIKFCMNGVRGVTKSANCVPHDLGDPEDEPWSNVNCYVIHPTHDWKDLNTKFVLQVYRDYHMTKSLSYLEDMFPCVQAVMETALKFDTDGDGVIENGGYADQTYDAWVATGTSAYCGGLWLAALKAIIAMARLLKRDDVDRRFSEILERGTRSFDQKLWNGKYYNYDTGSSTHSDSIMADQLCGLWYLRSCGLDDGKIFDSIKAQSALTTVFASNVMPFRSGCLGAVNGARPGGRKDTYSVQSEEFWTGVTYAVASSMIQQGMLAEAFQTAYGAYHTVYERRGLGFQTPEAYMERVIYRSLGYMRPLSIWSMQWALQQYHPDVASGTRTRALFDRMSDDRVQTQPVAADPSRRRVEVTI